MFDSLHDLATVVGYDTEGRFVWFSDMMLADSHVQSYTIVLTCLGFTWLFRL
jgi:phosphoribosylformylglycinamidine (FGAM) synthase-like amidotransferase family enzyme